jgi:hypothetical protein
MYFYLGVVYGKLFELTNLEVFFDLYNSSMANSVNIQDQYDIEDGPWVSPEEEQESLNSSDKM